MCLWAGEKAKIELSSKEESVISLNESDIGAKDESGSEIYVDIPFARKQLDDLIAAKVDEGIQSARETLEKAGLSPHDVERIVFVGGPTQYKPLRDKVAFEIGIAGSTDVNPMTAVAEGAAVFAESIDWASQSRGRKSARGAISAGGALDLSFNYVARTPESKARVVAKVGGTAAAGTEFQIDSLDTGWSSGRMALKEGATIELSLAKPGENTFKVFVFDSKGGPVALKESNIVIASDAVRSRTVDVLSAILVHEATHAERAIDEKACFYADNCETLPNGVDITEEIIAHSAEAQFWEELYGKDGKDVATGAATGENSLLDAYLSGTAKFSQFVRVLRGDTREGEGVVVS
jgi:hypothetical protein